MAGAEASDILADLAPLAAASPRPPGIEVPEISRFLGIVIRMYYREHAPPHFHASYGEYEVVVQIESGVVEGRFPRRALRHVLEWLELRRPELTEDWNLASERRPLRPIAPLE